MENLDMPVASGAKYTNYESCDILKLAQLLKPPDEESDSEDDLPGAGLQKISPGDICPKKPKPLKKPTTMKGEGRPLDEVQQYEEMMNMNDDSDILDSRAQPVYSISYKQAVTTEDIFLQMGCKSPATSSCEDMVVTIKLPGETRDSVELHVTKEAVGIDAKAHRLQLPLPHRVDPERSKAEWLVEEESLKLTLRMEREFDYVNF